MSSTATEVIWLKSLYAELKVKIEDTPIIWCDNTAANSLSINPIFHSRTKHIEVDVHFIGEKIEAKVLEVRYVSTELQKAEIFTKALSATRFCFLRDKLSLQDPQSILRGNVKEEAESDVARPADVA